MSGSENSTSPNLNSSSEGETLLTEGHAELALENLSRVERPLLLLGVGRTARALVAYIRGGLAQPENFSCGVIYGTTREEGRAAELKELGIEPLVLDKLLDFAAERQDGSKVGALKRLQELAKGALVLVSFPPDGTTDRILSEVVGAVAAKIVYISSTGVYGKQQGIIDEETDVDKQEPAARQRLAAEDIWRDCGAVVLRAPGLYDYSYGLHLRLIAGQYRLPGDGTNYVSRIHLDDLARIIVAAFLRAQARSLYLVGDLKPSTHLSVATWLCSELNMPLPESQSLASVNPTLRGNRQINARRVLRDLGVELSFPSYVEGYTDCLKKYRSASSVLR